MTLFHKLTVSFPRHRARSTWPLAIVIFFQIAFSSLALADDPIARVARVSLVEGEVSYQRADDSKEDWFDATLNLPLDESDQLYSGSDGRAEIQLSGRNIVRIDHNTNLRFAKFDTGAIQLALSVGTATFRITSLDRRQFEVVDAEDPDVDIPVYFEIDTPSAAVTLLKEGNYRINVREDGTTEVIVRSGEAEIDNQDQDVITLKEGRRIVVKGQEPKDIQIAALEDKDEWDLWNDRRDEELSALADNSRSPSYVPDVLPGVYDLDHYGAWSETPDYGWVWEPIGAPVDWAPYRDGCWRWHRSHGWTWVSYEPWGWLPYHYGRWAYHRNRWCWIPSVRFSSGRGWHWSPHLVVFFGSGGRPGPQAGRGWFGWCPLGPGERYYGRRTNTRDYPRSVDALRNYRAPGGVSRLDGRYFHNGRAVVTRAVLIDPRDKKWSKDFRKPVWVKDKDFKPVRVVPTRPTVVNQPDIKRRIETPVVVRRPPAQPGRPALPTRPGGRVAPRPGLPTRPGEKEGPRPSLPTRPGEKEGPRPSLPTRPGEKEGPRPSLPTRPGEKEGPRPSLPTRPGEKEGPRPSLPTRPGEKEGPRPSQPTRPTEGPRPSQPTRPTEAPRPSQPTRPTEGPRPSQPTRPTEGPRPSQPTRPTEAPRPSQPTRPTEGPRPSQPTRPTEGPRPSQPTRPTEAPRPSQPRRPVGTDVPRPDSPTAPADREVPRKSEENRQNEERQRAEEQRRQQEERQRAEEQRRQQEGRQRAEEQRRQIEEQRRQSEERQRAEEQRRQQEEQQRAEGQRRQQEEQRRQSEERQRAEEQRRQQEEQRRQQEERQRAEEQRRQQEEQRRQQEERQRAEEQRRQQEELRRQSEERQRAEEQRRQQEEQRRQQEERQRAEEQRRQQEEQRRQQEEQRRQQEERQRAEEQRRQQEEQRRQQEQQRRRPSLR